MTQLHWTAGLHHDSSALYVSNPAPALDETVTIRLRVPINPIIEKVILRTAPDGERHYTPMRLESQTTTCNIYTAPLPISMPLITYRFHIITGDSTVYLNALGVFEFEPLDALDFKLVADFATGEWVENAVFYQIFPDRFNNGNPSLTPRPGAWSREGYDVQVQEWNTLPLTWEEAGNLDFYGGDLPGIQQKIDYLKELGINAIYLNPIFASSSNHRYDINDFFQVDPHLGGNEALIDLRKALHRAGIRLMLDVTPNHTGWNHIWFKAAQQDRDAPTAEFYTFNQHPDDYVSWLGVRTLPKLNYRSQKLRDRMYRDADSVLLHWLHEPYKIDGWRLDVYNMTARQGELQIGHKIGRELRQAIKTHFPQSYLLGEHFFDGTAHLQGNELDASMNYQGFNIPLWRWLIASNHDYTPPPAKPDLLPISTAAFAGQLAHYHAAIPWIIARQQFNQLGSHDTRRILNIVDGNQQMAQLAAIMLMTYPGVPCVYYGDEVGLPGGDDPDNRRCMPWDRQTWNHGLFDLYKRLITLRKTAPALIEGGFQQLYADGDLWVFQRQAAQQRLIVIGYRGNTPLSEITIPIWHSGIADATKLNDLLSNQQFTVTEGNLTLNSLAPAQAMILEAEEK